jgi:predicted RNase H-like nuclease (RuvC/YqgF family)
MFSSKKVIEAKVKVASLQSKLAEQETTIKQLRKDLAEAKSYAIGTKFVSHGMLIYPHDDITVDRPDAIKKQFHTVNITSSMLTNSKDQGGNWCCIGKKMPTVIVELQLKYLVRCFVIQQTFVKK